MTTIASLGLQIDSGDAVEAKDNLDQLTDAGKRSEESAGKTGRAWESALGSLQGDTRQIVQELQVLNAKQSELAQQMATVGRAVTSASTAFSSAAANMTAFRTEAAQAGKVQEVLTSATDAGAQAGRRAAESADEQQARILAVARASMEASEYVQTLNRATAQTAEVTAQANAVLSDNASRQAAINSRAQAIIATEDRLADAARKTAGAHRDEGQALDELLGKIDPTVAAMSRLDQMEQKLKGFRSSGALDAETFGEYQAKIDQARTALGGADTALNRTGMTAKQTAAALRMVPMQFTDIVTSIAGGQPLMMVAIQQGGQLKDSLGGIGPAARALGGYVAGLVTPLTAAGAALAALGLAYYQGSKEQDAFRQSLVTTGNAAGATTSGLATMAKQVGSTVGTTGAAAAVLAQLAGTGKIVSSSFEQIAIAALSFEKATGRAASETVAEFAKLADDPVKAVVALNEKYHFLTSAVFSQIHALQEQGDTLGAQQIAEGAYADALTKRAEEIQRNLGYVERAWDSAKGAAKGAWDAFLDIGREDAFEDKLRRLEQRANIGAGGLGGGLLSGFEAAQGSRAEIGKEWTAVLQQEVDDQARARAAMFEASAVERGTKAYQALQKAIESTAPKSEILKKALEDNKREVAEARRAGYTITAEQEAALEAQTKAKFKPAAGRASAVNLSGFNDQKNALNAILAEYKNHQKELDAAQKAGLISQESYAAQRIAMAEQEKAEVTNAYEAEIRALEEAKGRSSTSAQQRIQLDQKIADARSAMVKAQKDSDTELSVLATNEQGRLAKQTAATQDYVDQLERQRAALSTSGTRTANAIGLGDRQQGLQRDLDGVTDRFNDERAKLLDRRRTAPDKYSQNDYERDLVILGKAEDKYRDTVVDNYDKISEAQGDWRKGASSAFQNYLEQARDVAGQTKSLFTNAFSSMEDAVVNFAMTGKFSFADFTKSIIADMARIATRQAASGLLSSIAGTALGAWFGGGGTAASTGASGAAGAAGSGGFDYGLGSASSGMTYTPTFSDGGYTGEGGKYDPAGIVHAGEFVLRREVVSQPGMLDYLETLNSRGYSDGGLVTSLPIPRQISSASTSGTSIQVSASVSVNTQDTSGQGGELNPALLQQNMQKQMQAAAERAVADSWRPGGVSYRNVNRRG
ncbi:phage tail tape measure protein [Pseudomonas japonica]|uniref:Phage tail tape measure protein, lambda family n=1 Tax=Pseudomonas japonica TaxID=256466 RepID=A0A239BRS1_9PSED|nr:phage tail tape measure protein [Pseudomonas japonica]SNS10576.1 phage tail tape measure protein, lambda family [Pseudomonas japonica]